MNKSLLPLFFILSSFFATATSAAGATFRYRVQLKDKLGSPYSISRPSEFLSQRAIDRRTRFGLTVDEHDLPIPPHYLAQIRATGVEVFNLSKWNNTVQIQLTDTTLLAAVRHLPFVVHTTLVYEQKEPEAETYPENRAAIITTKTTEHAHPYGASRHQIEQLQLHRLHEAGFKGKGLHIAVLDGGFYNADLIPLLRKTSLLGTRNFARPATSVFEESPHGMMVLSCMAPNVPRVFVGTAPEASYLLLVSEDTRAEYLGEEDNWCAAIEYADSIGVDLVNSSLGYYHYDHPTQALQYAWLDGKTQLISRSASLAASRGLLLLNAAGNEGDDRWKKISFPADATNMITVGAVDRHGQNAPFSGIGYAADRRVKPDAMAMGQNIRLLGNSGAVETADGTSFACPTLTGAMACLWQSCPEATPIELILALRQSSDRSSSPDEVYGYGIPDLWKAYLLLKTETEQRRERQKRVARDDW